MAAGWRGGGGTRGGEGESLGEGPVEGAGEGEEERRLRGCGEVAPSIQHNQPHSLGPRGLNCNGWQQADGGVGEGAVVIIHSSVLKNNTKNWFKFYFF